MILWIKLYIEVNHHKKNRFIIKNKKKSRILKKISITLISFIILFPALFSFVSENVTSQQNQEKTINNHHKGYRYNIQGWVYIHIEGEPYERGYQYGYLASAEIIDMIQRWGNLGHDSKFMKIFFIKNLQDNYDKLSQQWWNICRVTAMNFFLKQTPEEYIQEMKGITDGTKAQGGKIFGRNIEFEDIVASQFVQEVQYSISNIGKKIHPFLNILKKLDGVLTGEIFNNQNGHCNAFIATGDATSDGGIVVSHATIFPHYIAERCNFIVDIQPSDGNRFMMTSPPGALWSQEDWYLNDQGIVLSETELVPQGPWKIRGNLPKGVRSRTAIQYSDSIDDVLKYLEEGNNGLVPNEWLIGDTKTGEIASFQQALYNTELKRTFNGYYSSYCRAHDLEILSEITRVPKTILRVFSKISPALEIEDGKVIWKNDVAEKINQLGEKYYGIIDEDIAKKIMTTYPITEKTTDCKITSSKLMENMGFFAFFGPLDGGTWFPTNEEENKFHGVTELPVSDWVKIYPSLPEKEIDLLTNSYNNDKRGILSDIESDGLITAYPSVIDDAVYFGSWDGNVYALDSKNGHVKWSFKTGWGIDSTPYVSQDTVYVGSLDNNFYALDKETGELKWSFTCKAAIHSSPVVYGEYVFFGCDDGCFYALNKTNGNLAWDFTPEYSIKYNEVNNYITTPITSDPFIEEGMVNFNVKDKLYSLDTQTFEKPEKVLKEPSEFKNHILFLILVLVAIFSVALLLFYLKKKWSSS